MADQDLPQTKTCKKCGIAKPLRDFAGGRLRCRVCSPETRGRKAGVVSDGAEKAALFADGLKRCGVCKEVKPLDQFAIRRASKPDGRANKCRTCSAISSSSWREDNPGAFAEWYETNKGSRATYWAKWYENNKEHRAETYAAWARANPHIVRAVAARRVAAKLQATPRWASQEAIRAIYQEAIKLTRATGIPHEVDHIYPLQGKTVCGLHCETNLQILTEAENIRKHNRMPTDSETSSGAIPPPQSSFGF